MEYFFRFLFIKHQIFQNSPLQYNNSCHMVHSFFFDGLVWNGTVLAFFTFLSDQIEAFQHSEWMKVKKESKSGVKTSVFVSVFIYILKWKRALPQTQLSTTYLFRSQLPLCFLLTYLPIFHTTNNINLGSNKWCSIDMLKATNKHLHSVFAIVDVVVL